MWRVWTLTLLLAGTMGCAAVVLLPPTADNMSLVVGRFIIDDPSQTFFLRRYTKQGIEISIEGHKTAKVITDEEGYFYIPNLAPGNYLLTRSKYTETIFTPARRTINLNVRLANLPERTFDVPASSVLFLGTYVLKASSNIRRGAWKDIENVRRRTIRRTYDLRFKREFQVAKTDFLKSYGQTPWAQKSLKINQNYDLAPANSGRLNQRMGRYELSISEMEKTFKVNSSRAYTHNVLCWTLKSVGKLAKAVEACKRAIAINPGSKWAYRSLGILYKETGKLGDAISALTKALKIDPNYVGAHAQLAIIYQKQGRIDDAEEHLRIIREIKKRPMLESPALGFRWTPD